MSTLTQFLGGNRPATLLPSATSGNAIGVNVNDDPGALTANVWKQVLSVTGAGVLHAAVIRHAGATSQQVGIRAIIDGTTAVSIDEPAAGTASGAGCMIGIDNSLLTGGTAVAQGAGNFSTSLVIEVRSNVSTSEPRFRVAYTRFA